MKITVSVDENQLKIDHPIDDAKNAKEFWTFAANEWHRMIYKYTPYRTGALSSQVIIRPKEIEYKMYYATHVYNGTHMHFRKDHHPLASAKWDDAAKPTELPKLVQSLQNYIDSGRLDL